MKDEFESNIVCSNCGFKLEELDVINGVSDTFFKGSHLSRSHLITCPNCGKDFETVIDY